MTLRLASGSLRPASRARKRSSASTATSGTLKVSRKAAITCSPSPLRIRPWSTNTQVSWSPIARCTSSAATEESTPPERPQITVPSPTCARIRAICSSAIDAALQLRSAPQMSSRKRRQDLLAERRVDDLGVKLDRVDPALGVLERGDRGGRRGGELGEPSGGAADAVAVRHPAGLLARQPGSRRPGSRTSSSERPNSPTSARSTTPPSACASSCMP